MTTVRAGVAQVRGYRDTAEAIKGVEEMAAAAAADGADTISGGPTS